MHIERNIHDTIAFSKYLQTTRGAKHKHYDVLSPTCKPLHMMRESDPVSVNHGPTSGIVRCSEVHMNGTLYQLTAEETGVYSAV